MKKLILGSGSPRRRELMSQVGLEFEVIVSDADESTGETQPDKMVMELSKKKAMAVWNSLDDKKRADSVVIGADTIVYSDGNVLGKPKDEEDAFNMIKSFAGKAHSVFTGVTMIAGSSCEDDCSTSIAIDSFAEETKVYVYPMNDDEIRGYVSTSASVNKDGVSRWDSTKTPFECEDKAGSYGIQGLFAAYIKGIEGDYNNVVGLPVARVYQELKKAGYINE
ncbi:MAG: Maf family protein [Lachnospira sp.]|nr:Maf family protein [Lachnospira sp.]